MERIEKRYKEEILPELFKEQGYQSIMQVPKVTKIVINVGAGDATHNSKAIEDVVSELSLIAGLRPVVTLAKGSIASFKLREGMPIGAKVTLRGKKMYQFLDKLINIALPRVRDFRGVSKDAFDGRGNYSLGIKEQIIFPEIDYDKVKKIRGMDITIVTSANKNEDAYALLKKMGMPFKK
ncbi:50S ribosomal protein L5 [Spiroplasma sp. DGKH1]|uniref:50S ribosomal protein L5 n=1 Tax=Spiroplasma sp. DGKH1 TaxID=3050074 RepID=UPI0034C620C7